MESKTADAPEKLVAKRQVRYPEIRLFLENHLSHLMTAGIGLIAAIAALLAAMWGAGIGADAALKVATMQNQAEDVRRSQDQRDVAYKDYLNAANKYFYAWNSLATAKKPVLVDTAAEYVVEFMTARTAYQSQVNEVFVYGSDDAWSAHQDIARTLPRAVAGSQLPDPAAMPDTKAFGAAFSAFLDVRCREVTALSRGSCSQG